MVMLHVIKLECRLNEKETDMEIADELRRRKANVCAVKDKMVTVTNE